MKLLLRYFLRKHFEIRTQLVSCVSKWHSKAWGSNIAKITLQNIVWLILISDILKVEIVNNSFDGMEIDDSYERLCFYFYSILSLCFLADEPDPRYIYNYPASLKFVLSQYEKEKNYPRKETGFSQWSKQISNNNQLLG